MSYSIPSFYDHILPNDYLMAYMNQAESKADSGFEVPYFLPTPGGELAPAYPTYNVPPFSQTPPSFPSTPSSSAASSMSWDSSWSQSSSTPPLNNLSSQPTLEPETEKSEVKPPVAKPAKRKRRSNSVGRTGDQIKRPARMSHKEIFVRVFFKHGSRKAHL